MRLIHTSDWHLGRSFHQVGLEDAHAAFADHLVETVRAEHVDAVLVSGDIYDRALPGQDSVALLSDTLMRLADTGAQIILSSGNHDSAIRLGFAAGLLERSGVHIRADVRDVGRPVVIGDVAVHPLPYLEPSQTAQWLGTDDRTHAGVLRAAMDRVHADARTRAGRTVIMAHAFVTGGVTSDSERDISVGGVSAVSPSVFDGIDYAALGHLHGRKQISDSVRYSGSPVAMSFSEADHLKGSWLVDLDESGVRSEFVEAPVHRGLSVLRGDLDTLLADSRFAGAENDWCQVTLTDAVRPLAAMDTIRRRFPHTLSLTFDPQGLIRPAHSYAAKVESRPDADLCCDFLTHVRAGHPATAEERALIEDAVEDVRLRRAERAGEGDAAAAVVGAA
ncbi:exonuclease SbcCD subunit D [Janibacter sp. G1551]|uniref:exonuclease SbcCD subunit D n=1 Tax=Janibacter sp. G1551 TaxID=3420440 RepID=UPI003CFC5DC5